MYERQLAIADVQCGLKLFGDHYHRPLSSKSAIRASHLKEAAVLARAAVPEEDLTSHLLGVLHWCGCLVLPKG